ncbi:MAG: DUF4190 domain-containing protein [Actinomycetota bacterium]
MPAPSGYVNFGSPSATYPERSKAGWALAWSIIGFLCCALPAIAGVVMGRNEMQAIDAGRIDPRHRGMAQAAYIVGIVALVVVGGLIFLSLLGNLVTT